MTKHDSVISPFRRPVLEGIWDGHSTVVIASLMGCSPKTVEYHRMRLFHQFGVDNPVSLCRRALFLGELKLSPGPEM